jgi:hypothetical protein
MAPAKTYRNDMVFSLLILTSVYFGRHEPKLVIVDIGAVNGTGIIYRSNLTAILPLAYPGIDGPAAAWRRCQFCQVTLLLARRRSS